MDPPLPLPGHNYVEAFRYALSKIKGDPPRPRLYFMQPHWWRLFALTKHAYTLVLFVCAIIILSLAVSLPKSTAAYYYVIIMAIGAAIPILYITKLLAWPFKLSWPELKPGVFHENAHIYASVWLCAKAPWLWVPFWTLYLHLDVLNQFYGTYATMWRAYFQAKDDEAEPMSLIMFLDGDLSFEVPIGSRFNDRELMFHLSQFYYAQKIRKGILEHIGFRTLGVVEVVELHGNIAAGRRDTVLGLGRYKDNRMIHFLHKRERLYGSALVTALKERQVITKSGNGQPDKPRALNFVSTWHFGYAGFVVVLPVLASLVVSVVWSVVAVTKFHQDAQTSVQTAFTIGSYVVTAGALLVALVTFAATANDGGAKYTDGLQSDIIRV